LPHRPYPGREEALGADARVGVPYGLAYSDVKSGEQRCSPEPFLIIGLPFRQTDPERENRLRPV
jgi:hypothetical protein